MTDAEVSCFDHCECTCGPTGATFDRIAKSEMREPLRLDEICRQNIGWYCDRSLTDHHLELWDLKKRSGVYFLWHKNDYCPVHEMFHMRALYVGKGWFSSRIRDHFKKQPTEVQQLIYFTYAELPNRLAKYTEQLILDCYNLPLNKAENLGKETLCAQFSQFEVD